MILEPDSTFEQEPLTMSFSRVSTFLRCPYQYFLSYVKKLPQVAGLPLIIGRAFHEGQKYAADQMRGYATPPTKEVIDYSVSEYETATEDEGTWETDAWDYSKEISKNDLIKMSTVAFEHSTAKSHPVAAEEQFEVTIDGNIKLKGFIDRQDKVDDGIGIVELKTSKQKTPLTQIFDYQTGIYQKAKEHTVKGIRRVLTLRHQTKNRDISVIQYTKKPDPPSLIEDIIQSVKVTYYTIQSCLTNGFPKTSDLSTCAWCSHRRTCRPEIFAGNIADIIHIETSYTSRPPKKEKQNETAVDN